MSRCRVRFVVHSWLPLPILGPYPQLDYTAATRNRTCNSPFTEWFLSGGYYDYYTILKANEEYIFFEEVLDD